MTRATYVLRDGALVEKRTGETFRGQSIARPMVMRDIPEYRSPIDGRLITSRSWRREDMKANGCVEYEPHPDIVRDSKGRPQFINRDFCQRRGLPHTPATLTRREPEVTLSEAHERAISEAWDRAIHGS